MPWRGRMRVGLSAEPGASPHPCRCCLLRHAGCTAACTIVEALATIPYRKQQVLDLLTRYHLRAGAQVAGLHPGSPPTLPGESTGPGRREARLRCSHLLSCGRPQKPRRAEQPRAVVITAVVVTESAASVFEVLGAQWLLGTRCLM